MTTEAPATLPSTAEIATMSPAEAAALLGKLTAAHRAQPTDTPSAQLAAKQDDPAFRARILAGDLTAIREWEQARLSAKAEADPVAAAMSGTLPEQSSGELRRMADDAVALRALGMNERVVREMLSGEPVTPEIRAEAERWKAQHMRDAEWVKRVLANDVEAVRQLHLCSIVLAQPIKG